jgi:hypothetical protein
MTRIIIAILLALTVSPAMATEDSVLLHCSGEKLHFHHYSPFSLNIEMSVTGAWISVPYLNIKERPRNVRTSKNEFDWGFGDDDHVYGIGFNASQMYLEITGEDTDGGLSTIRAACFPITNPFMQGTEQ